VGGGAGAAGFGGRPGPAGGRSAGSRTNASQETPRADAKASAVSQVGLFSRCSSLRTTPTARPAGPRELPLPRKDEAMLTCEECGGPLERFEAEPYFPTCYRAELLREVEAADAEAAVGALG
jgi:hypothetical protein